MAELNGGDLSGSLLKLISEYQLHVLGFVQAFRRRYGVEDILRAWRAGEVPQRGTLDDRHETRFTFHGCGCRCESDRATVDFDLGPDGRHDGFDGWRLWLFAQSVPDEHPQFQRHEVVESVLGDLVTDGIVHRPHWAPSPHLCYLIESAS